MTTNSPVTAEAPERIVFTLETFSLHQQRVEYLTAILATAAEKARQEEREANARIAEGASIYSENHIVRQTVFPEQMRTRIAALIRARSEQKVEQ